MNLYFERRTTLGELIYAGWMAGIMAGVFGVVLILLRADGEGAWVPFARTALGLFGSTATAGFYAGVLSGMMAGGVMAIFLAMASASRGREMVAPIRMIAATVYGEQALQGPARFPILLTGLMIHFMTAALFGLIWVALLGRTSYPAAILGGAVYGLFIWAVQEYAILPAINKPLARRMDPGLFAAAHLLFGAMLGFYPFFFEQGLAPGAYIPAVWVGLFALFAISEMAGMFFALLGGDWTIGRGVRWGVFYGLLLWLLIHGGLYAVNPGLARVVATLPFALWNILIGMVIGTYPAFLEPRPEESVKRKELKRAA